MQFGQSVCGGKLVFPQSPHFVVTNLPSDRASQKRLVFDIGMSNLRLRLRFEWRVRGVGTPATHFDLERTVT
jgi:hypothetical protein